MIYGTDHPAYIERYRRMRGGRFNGAYFYSLEIERNIIPNVDTDRPWVLLNKIGCEDRAIVFVHNNLKPQNYDWLEKYDDLVLVCGIPETVAKVSHLGSAIYLPLSIDVEEVEGYRERIKTREVAYFGRRCKGAGVPTGTPHISCLRRPIALREVALTRNVYAVGRCAIEARALGCRLLPYDPRFPDVDRWKVVDNRDAAKILQRQLDEIDGRTVCTYTA